MAERLSARNANAVRLAVDEAVTERQKRWRLVYCALLLRGESEASQLVQTAAALLNSLEAGAGRALAARSAVAGGSMQPQRGNRRAGAGAGTGAGRELFFDEGDCVDRAALQSVVGKGLEQLESLGLVAQTAGGWEAVDVEGGIAVASMRLSP